MTELQHTLSHSIKPCANGSFCNAVPCRCKATFEQWYRDNHLQRPVSARMPGIGVETLQKQIEEFIKHGRDLREPTLVPLLKNLERSDIYDCSRTPPVLLPLIDAFRFWEPGEEDWEGVERGLNRLLDLRQIAGVPEEALEILTVFKTSEKAKKKAAAGE